MKWRINSSVNVPDRRPPPIINYFIIYLYLFISIINWLINSIDYLFLFIYFYLFIFIYLFD